jgi:plastocyanin
MSVNAEKNTVLMNIPEIKQELKPEVKPEVVTPASAAPTKLFDIKGVISFSGTPPLGKTLSLPGGCAKGGPSRTDEVIVKDGKIENVLVRIVKGQEGKSFKDVPSSPIILNQKNCVYHPRVAAARVGQEVIFVNSDPIFHNVRSISNLNQKFNLAMPKLDQRISKRFDKAEFFVQTKCSVHPWMSANLAIMDHPFYSISNNKGEFEIRGLSAGNYTLEVWHEVFGTETKEILVNETGMSDFNFTFKPLDKK